MTKAKRLLEIFRGISKAGSTYSNSFGTEYLKTITIDGHKLTLEYILKSNGTLDLVFDVDDDIELLNIGPKFAIKVFSEAAKHLRGVVKDIGLSNIEKIEFSSDVTEPSRLKLYDRLAKEIAKEYGGYITHREERRDLFYTINLR